MPLDDLQTAILRLLSQNRTPESVFAGGSVLHRHGHRLSDDQDIFHVGDIDLHGVAASDVRLLEENGFTCRRTKVFEGFAEYEVGTAEQGFSRVQWVQAGEWNFFASVPDPEYGWRLHYADLGVNKVLAAAGRKEVRDFVDLALVQDSIMPLWHALWAAPGKDEEWSPRSLVERIRAHAGFRQADVQHILSLDDIDIGAVLRKVRLALDDAVSVFDHLSRETVGKLFVGADGEVVLDPAMLAAPGVRAIEPQRGGAWVSGPDIDHAIIQRVIRDRGTADEWRAAFSVVNANPQCLHRLLSEQAAERMATMALRHAGTLPTNSPTRTAVEVAVRAWREAQSGIAQPAPPADHSLAAPHIKPR